MAATAQKPETNKPESLVETVLCEGTLTLDREASVIRGVKLLGLESKNGRSYSAGAARAAIGLYEGSRVNVNHPERPGAPRDLRDRIGTISGVQFRDLPSPGLYGDFRYNPKHALAEQVIWAAENDPSSLGFSHNAEGRAVRRSGKTIVEEITRVRSVDLVADPATTTSLRESVEDVMTLSEIVAANKQGGSPLVAILEGFIAAQPNNGDMQVPNMPGVAAGEAEPSGVRSALVAAVAEAAKQAATDDDLLDLLKKLIGSAKTEDPAMADTNKPADGDKTTEKPVEKPVAEQISEAIAESLKPLTEQVAGQQKRLDAYSVLAGKGAQATDSLVEELVACTDKAAMTKLVEGMTPAKLGLRKPHSGGSAAAALGEYPKDKDAFVRALKQR